MKIIDKWDRTTRKNDLEYNLLETLYIWIKKEKQALLCIDSPLGWPSLIGKAISDHKAGKSIDFIEGRCKQPDIVDDELTTEGWIWAE